ncbi:MAG: hypothetical protein AAF317_12760, partial [Pseudomonadota bacterium]
LTREAEERRRAFFANVTPILLQILRETGAAAVVDQRSILISKQDLNITEEVIKRLDQRIDEEAPDVPPGAQDDSRKTGATPRGTPISTILPSMTCWR